MKEEYDFSKGIKGKFFIPIEEIELPVYLSMENQKFYFNLAKEKNLSMSLLINKFLEKEKDVLFLLESKEKQ